VFVPAREINFQHDVCSYLRFSFVCCVLGNRRCYRAAWRNCWKPYS